MKGRKPGLDTLKKRLAGTYSGPAPDCPDWLDDDARAEWARVAPELARAGVLTPVDAMTLAAYCQTYSQWKQAEQRVRADGLMIDGPRGNPTLHPCARHAVTLLAELRRVAGEFGFTPAARARVEAAPPTNAEQDAFAEFTGG